MKLISTSHYFTACFLSGLLLFFSPTKIAIAQVDEARRTSAFTYPAGKSVTLAFRSLPRFPKMNAVAIVERVDQMTKIDVRARKMPPPLELGPGYATYVVWAVSPDGQIDNIGELIPNGSLEFDAQLQVSSALQSFSLIITAEPHFLVRHPSRQIMLENESARMPGGTEISPLQGVQYFGDTSEYFRDSRTPVISDSEYARTPTVLLQAKQAIALARFAGAERDAAEDIASAVKSLREAEASFTSGRTAKEIDETAKIAIRNAVKAETVAAVRKMARERRNEQVRSDAETRRNEDKVKEAEAEIAELKARLAEESRSRELSERDVSSLQALLKKAEQNVQIHSPTQSDQSTVRLARYPTVETRSEVRKREKFSVQISLTEEKVAEAVKVVGLGKDAGQEADGKLSISLPDRPNVNEWEIDVVLSAASGDFAFTGSDTATLTLPRVGSSTTARFTLTAKDFSETERRSRIFVSFYNKSSETFLARVEKEIIIKDAAVLSDAQAQQSRRARSDAEASAPLAIPERIESAEPASAAKTVPGTVAFSFKDVPPDLTVSIRTKVFPHQAANSLITLTSPHLKNTIRQGEFARPSELDVLLLSRFAEFSSLSSRDVGVNGYAASGPPAAPAVMRGFGEKLYDDYAPLIFKETFWELREKLGDKFKSILIITDDPNFPWELIRPRRDAKSVAGEFLGLDFAVGRLHAPGGKTVGDSQPQSAVVSGITVIAPTYQGSQALPQVAKEVDFIKTLSLFDLLDGVRRSDGKYENLQILFEKTPAHIIHFAGHGTSQGSGVLPNSAVQLSDSMLNSDAWRGLLGRFGANRPFFFFNACEVGRAGNFSGFVEGFAPTVLEAGASGFIGALWSIGDGGAEGFAEKFYATLTEELSKEGSSVSMADLVRKTKREYFKTGDPTYLAYVFYGDPNLRLAKRPTK